MPWIIRRENLHEGNENDPVETDDTWIMRPFFAQTGFSPRRIAMPRVDKCPVGKLEQAQQAVIELSCISLADSPRSPTANQEWIATEEAVEPEDACTRGRAALEGQGDP